MEGQLCKTKQTLKPLFVHSFKVCVKVHFLIYSSPKVFLRLHIFHSLTLNVCDVRCAEIHNHVFGFQYIKLKTQLIRHLTKCSMTGSWLVCCATDYQ